MFHFLLVLWLITIIPGLLLGIQMLTETDPKLGVGWRRPEVWGFTIISIIPVLSLAPAVLGTIYAIGAYRTKLSQHLCNKLAAYSYMNVKVLIQIKNPDSGEIEDNWSNAIQVSRCICCGCDDIDQTIRAGHELYTCSSCGNQQGSVPDWNNANLWPSHYHAYCRTKTIRELHRLSKQTGFDEAEFFNFVQSRIKE